MKKVLIGIILIWVILVGASMMWNLHITQKEHQSVAFQVAKNIFELIEVTRKWNSDHGGLYVFISEQTQPNPYLEDRLKVLHTRGGLKLTKINPAYMTRQISELAIEKNRIQFHITSLSPIRPANRANDLEREALEAFEKGVPETGRFLTHKGHPYFFYMAPLKAELGCLKCHAKYGDKEGDIRGGISVLLPVVDPSRMGILVMIYGLIGLGGLVFIVFFGFNLERAYQKIRRQAIQDGLTGIFNRRWFSYHLLKEIGRSQRERQPLSLIMCDIDKFKLFNDTYGHSLGDDCLIKVARAIQDSLRRPGDFCARYGGEEFVVVLGNTPASGALKIGETIRSAVQDLKIPHQVSASLKTVTISIGITTTHNAHPNAIEKLINEADRALYRAKKKGRNRVEVFGLLPSSQQ